MEKNTDQKKAELRALFAENEGGSAHGQSSADGSDSGSVGKFSNLLQPFRKKSSSIGKVADSMENINLIEKKKVLSPLHSEEANFLLPSFHEQGQKQNLLDLLRDGKDKLKPLKTDGTPTSSDFENIVLDKTVKLPKKQENRNLWTSMTYAFRNLLGTSSQQDEPPRGEETSLLSTDTRKNFKSYNTELAEFKK